MKGTGKATYLGKKIIRLGKIPDKSEVGGVNKELNMKIHLVSAGIILMIAE